MVAAAVIALAHAAGALAATYKWVDDKGVTHYSDKLPPEAINRGNVVLDRQAVPIRKVDPAPTPDQVRSKQEAAERAETAAREQEIRDRRDRALLMSYTSEAEIDLARTRAIGTIDAQLMSAQAFSAQLTKRKEVLAQKKAVAGDKGLPAAEERELEGVLGELPKQKALIEQKQKEREVTMARYDADKARWRELRVIADANKNAAAGTGPRASASPGSPAPYAAGEPKPPARK